MSDDDEATKRALAPHVETAIREHFDWLKKTDKIVDYELVFSGDVSTVRIRTKPVADHIVLDIGFVETPASSPIRFVVPPQHTHTCDECADCSWLGRDFLYDLYICRSPSRGDVLIARYGNRTHDFATLSLTHYKGAIDELTEPFATAYARARTAGLI